MPDLCAPVVCPGMGPIYMNEVKCLGQEKSIWNCPFKNITSEDCKHAEDAAVRCNVPYMGHENAVRADPSLTPCPIKTVLFTLGKCRRNVI